MVPTVLGLLGVTPLQRGDSPSEGERQAQPAPVAVAVAMSPAGKAWWLHSSVPAWLFGAGVAGREPVAGGRVADGRPMATGKPRISPQESGCQISCKQEIR